MSQDEIRETLRKERRGLTIAELAIYTGCHPRTVAMQVQQMNTRWQELTITRAAGCYIIELKAKKVEK